jgi:ferredoxin-NADP reductase
MPRQIQLAETPPRIPLRVLENRAYPGGLFTLRLEPVSTAWQPGDCIAVYAPNSGESRPYSLSGGVDDPYIELFIRKIDGGLVSEWLFHRVAGDRIEVSTPFGWFRTAEPEPAPKIYFATGSGIAPFWSALRSGADQPRAAYWGVRSLDDVVLPDLFTSLEICVSQGASGPWRSGRITSCLQEIPLLPEAHYYACGVDRMIEEVAAGLMKRGVDEDRIHRECFFTG